MSIFIKDTGEPYVDSKGNLSFFTGDLQFKQRIINLFRTQKDSEPLYLGYGFDHITMVTASPSLRQQLAEIITADALNVQQVQDLYGIRNIDVTVVGKVINVAFNITATDGTNYSEQFNMEYE